MTYLVPPVIGPCVGFTMLSPNKGEYLFDLNFWVAFADEDSFPTSEPKIFFRTRQTGRPWQVPEQAFVVLNLPSKPPRSYTELSLLRRQKAETVGGYSVMTISIQEIAVDLDSPLELQVFRQKSDFPIEYLEVSTPLTLSDEEVTEQTHAQLDRALEANEHAYSLLEGAASNPPWLSQLFHSWKSRATFYVAKECLLALSTKAQSVSFLSACCRHPGLGFDEERVDASMRRALDDKVFSDEFSSPAFSLLVGDQIYADASAGLNDPVSPIERFVDVHAKAYRAQGLGQLFKQMPVFMAADDHEWADDYPNGIPLVHTKPNRALAKATADWAVRTFQYRHVIDANAPDLNYKADNFSSLDMFVVDTRTERTRGGAEIFSAATENKLMAWLHAPRSGKLKVLVSASVILPGLVEDSDPSKPGVLDNSQGDTEQRTRLIEAIIKAGEAGGPILLISGDYHLSGIAALFNQEGTPVGACLIVPPLYAPWIFSNTAPDRLKLDEVFGSGGVAAAQRALSVRPIEGGAFLRGNGVCKITIAPSQTDTSQFSVVFERSLLDLNGPSATPTSYCAHLDL